MVHNNGHQHIQKQQISQKVQQPNFQHPRMQPNMQHANRQQQEHIFVSRPANSQPQQPIFAAGQEQSRMSQPSMPLLQQYQQLSGAESDRLRMQRNTNSFQNINPSELLSSQQTLQLHQQPHFQKAIDKRFTGSPPQQHGMINQQKPLNQSEKVLPKDSSALIDSTTPSNQSERLIDHDRLYEKVQAMRHTYSGALHDAYRKVCVASSQNPELATRSRAIQMFLETISKDFRMSRAEVKNLTMDNAKKLVRRMVMFKSFLASYNNSASGQHRQQQQPLPGSQSQLPDQQMKMKVPILEAATSHQMPAQLVISNSQANKINAANAGSVASAELKVAVRSMDQQTRHQMLQAQNVNQPIQQTLLDPKKQPMSVQKKTCNVNGSSLGQVMRNSPGLLKRHHSVYQLGELPHLIANSPQTFQQPSSQVHREIRNPHLSTVRTPLQKVALEPHGSSRSSSLSSEKRSSAISPYSAGSFEQSQGAAKDDQIISQTINKNQATSIGSLEILASPLMQEICVPEETQKGISNESALQRFLEVVKSMSDKALCATVEDIASIMNTIDTIDGATVDCELGTFTYPDNLLHGGKLDSLPGMASSRKMKRHFGVISTPTEVTPSAGFQGLSRQTNSLDSIAEHRTKMPKFQHNAVLLDEIKETNNRLVETVLEVVSDSTKNTSNTDIDEGTIVRCSYTPVGLGRNTELQNSTSRLLPLFCIQLLVPADYPKSCPVMLNDDSSLCDLTKKVNARFSSSLCLLSQPPSLKEMARKWDECARSVLAEFAATIGGGSFSTKYGRWESCI